MTLPEGNEKNDADCGLVKLPDQDAEERHEDESSQPNILPDWVDPESTLLASDKLQQRRLDDEQTARVRRDSQQWWFRGHFKRRFELFLQENDLSAAQVAKSLMISSSAVSHWTKGCNAIASDQLEVLQRLFPQIGEVPPSHRHEVDLTGYQVAIGIARYGAPRGKQPPPEVDALTFWRLWFLMRSRQWLAAHNAGNEELKREAALLINNRAERTFLGNRAIPVRTSERPNAGSVDVDWVDDCVVGWGTAFVFVVVSLDDVCWTAPHAG